MITREEMNEFVRENGIRVLPQRSEEADDAIYITPDGTFLSGRSEDAVRVGFSERDIDHRCTVFLMDTDPYTSNTFWADMFKKTGFVMVVPEQRQYIVVEAPTMAQKASCEWLESFGYTCGKWA